jgi:acylphosphatase
VDDRARRVIRLDASVRGVVQGVGFRVFVIGAARRLGVRGWVANERDGRVRCVAEGERAALEELLGELRRGPAGALVEDVREAWLPPTGEFTGFSIRSAWHPGD